VDVAKAARILRRRSTGGRSGRRPHGGVATWLAWAIWALAVLLGAAAVVFDARNRRIPQEVTSWGLLAAGTALLFCTPGALIVARRPRNSVGWILCAVGLGLTVSAAAGGYGLYAAVTARGSLPGGVPAMWLGDLLFGPALGLIPLLFVVFPDGRLPSRGWRPAVWLFAVVLAGVAVLNALVPRHLGGVDSAPLNPTGILNADSRLLGLSALGLLYLLGFMLGALLALRVRYQRARAAERQQLKWFLVGASALMGTVGGAFFWLFGTYVVPVALLGFGLFTSCVAIAILRYRLYDIDRLISRTLTYGLLSAVLGLGYAGTVLVLRQALQGTRDSSLAVAASTLAVAAVFQPARRRIQVAVDRRFNRRRYDAARTIEAFSERLRQQLDLEALAGELLTVVDQTMQPTSVSIWLASQQPQQPQRHASPPNT
jgi:MFS family permease